MARTSSLPLVAVDIGNSRIKFGVFQQPFADPLPQPNRDLAIGHDWTDRDLETFLAGDPAAYAWSIASVNRPAAARLAAWLESRQAADLQVLGHADLPLAIELARPDLVGLDRLVNAVAANRLRAANQSALVIDFGSAITVDLVNEHGVFVGGAIMAGIAMAARALHEFTDLLPQIEVTKPPTALGTSTLAAISSGLYWGTVGAVRELITRLASGPVRPQVLLTGGGAAEFAAILAERSDETPRYVPHLTLAGIVLSAGGTATKKGSR
jgi:type III pantothenate kinase